MKINREKESHCREYRIIYLIYLYITIYTYINKHNQHAPTLWLCIRQTLDNFFISNSADPHCGYKYNKKGYYNNTEITAAVKRGVISPQPASNQSYSFTHLTVILNS